MQTVFFILIGIYVVWYRIAELPLFFRALTMTENTYNLIKLSLVLQGRFANGTYQTLKRNAITALFKGLFVRACVVSILVFLVHKFV